jgi:type I restriction enzyme S subunit
VSAPIDKSTWKKVKFGDVVRNVNETVSGSVTTLDRAIAMEHLEPGCLEVKSWGEAAETTFTRRVKPGQTLFGKRRAYQRKVAYASFDAVCSGDILTLESADPTKLLGELLPFLCMTEPFFEHAVGTSAGSLSPRTRWSDLASYEFLLPPIGEQKRIADLLWSVEAYVEELRDKASSVEDLGEALVDLALRTGERSRRLGDYFTVRREVVAGTSVPNGAYLLGLENLYPRASSPNGQLQHLDSQVAEFSAGDVLFGKLRPALRKVAIAPANGWCSTEIVVLRPTAVTTTELHLVVSSNAVFREMSHGTFGSVMPRADVASLRQLPVPDLCSPPVASLLRHAALVFSAREVVRAEISSVHALRNELLKTVVG